jgi:uncharacterized membrane protein YjgN (DUF898 family)
MEQAASCIFKAAAVFGMHRYRPRQRSLVCYQIIPGVCLLLVLVFSTVYFIIVDWCIIDDSNNECWIKNINVTIICFTFVYELVMCFLCALSFYSGTLKCDAKFEIITRMEKVAQVLSCTGRINTSAKKTKKLCLIVTCPAISIMIYTGLSTRGPLTYLSVFKELKVWIPFFSILIWEWKYVFFASVQGNLFNELNKQIQVQFFIFNCI